ncbi:MAG TPA: SAM-dependent methyltransferase, partial [Chthoniobacterales bacterium]|nr:SAM-dependent methyltransferase [Chthoniobacterales bacterium]
GKSQAALNRGTVAAKEAFVASLEEILRETIAREGPITFARFMGAALYHPELGHYSSGRCAIGRRGDYFTSVSVGPLFGKLLAAQFVEVWEKLDRPDEFTIAEQGAHEGEFAGDVLASLRADHPECFAATRYRIVEPFPILWERQQAALETFAGKIEWYPSLETMAPFRGVHFSNELLDSLPVHLIAAENGSWQERRVTTTADGFAFVDQPLADEQLITRTKKIPLLPNERYETEVNLAALDWLSALAPKLRAGLILIADYGWPRAEFYAPHRRTGTLQSFAEHRVLPSPLERVGKSDITSHVEWTSLAERAEELSLTIGGFADQHHFLTGLLASAPELAGANNRALQTLLHPEFLGSRFQFLGLTTTDAPYFSGFAFGRKRHALGLR